VVGVDALSRLPVDEDQRLEAVVRSVAGPAEVEEPDDGLSRP